MYRISILFCIFSLFMMVSCDQGQTTSTSSSKEEKVATPAALLPSEVIYKEVMKIHDDVMPKVKDINRLQKKLKAELKAPTATTNKEEIQSILKQLDEADKGMWDWMGAFKQPSKDSPQDSIIQYLQQEKSTISKVSEDMLTSIATAKKYLDQ